ncbi:MAG: AbrB/MazE/SpoVT family DNA-binding domain-containing protein [Candidatus Bathyarchaeia archaeon]
MSVEVSVGRGVGVGETVVDGRWRVTIPRKYRKGIKPGDKLVVESRGGVIVLRKEGVDAVKRFEEIKLYVDEQMRAVSAEAGKHRYGGVKE